MKDMWIVSKTEATKIFHTSQGYQVSAVVSIGDPNEKPPTGMRARERAILRMEFHDVDRNDEGYVRFGIVPPNKIDIKKLIRSAKALIDTPNVLLIHCYAGISRSTTTGFILKAIELGAGHEQEAFDFVKEKCPWMSPNSLMIFIAQAELPEFDIISPLKNWQKLNKL
ncbi:MAG: hypothetical protein UT24_C0018G0006 [Candidatus Woesebacteria bacterium GW2011_GWB1_39_12]|uniref:Tyrosine specific protein phosphatases domain-containing protein n=1 Tax=Candidatus Woesebacteria bacterium GW2011_GWB1_39_12 TaxID=1618574 RepID=A0A0G0M793_9BACT|nr:MAG: hypothetical protein UT24_C0018G0006 [Candidatus Woesebacteria bacterium GW2011_GWB1_39_12]